MKGFLVLSFSYLEPAQRTQGEGGRKAPSWLPAADQVLMLRKAGHAAGLLACFEADSC